MSPSWVCLLDYVLGSRQKNDDEILQQSPANCFAITSSAPLLYSSVLRGRQEYGDEHMNVTNGRR